MSLITRLMIFMLVFNISVGLLSYVIGAEISGANSNAWQLNQQDLASQFNKSTVLPAESSQNFWYRFLDIISLGLFNKIQIILNTTIFGIPALLNSTGIISGGLMIFINAILTVIYTLGIFSLFTGKDLTMR